MSQSQLHPIPPPRPSRPSGGERVFSDDDGREWSAVSFLMPAGRATGGACAPCDAVVFTCTTDARLAQRATSAPANTRLTDIPELTMRTWLAHAPRLVRLS